MNLILRVILLLACVRFALQAMVGYAFDFREHGYPLWPLLGLGLSFAAYVKIRPQPAKRSRQEPPQEVFVDHAFLFLVLAVVTSAFLLDKRGESPLTPLYFLHLSALTLFQLLLPYIITFGLKKTRSLATMVVMLILMALLVDGTMKDPQPIKQFLEETGTYESPESLAAPLPISIAPPGRAMPLVQPPPLKKIPPSFEDRTLK